MLILNKKHEKKWLSQKNKRIFFNFFLKLCNKMSIRDFFGTRICSENVFSWSYVDSQTKNTQEYTKIHKNKIKQTRNAQRRKKNCHFFIIIFLFWKKNIEKKKWWDDDQPFPTKLVLKVRFSDFKE